MENQTIGTGDILQDQAEERGDQVVFVAFSATDEWNKIINYRSKYRSKGE